MFGEADVSVTCPLPVGKETDTFNPEPQDLWNGSVGPGLTQWLRSCIALIHFQEDPSSFPSTHVEPLTTICNSSSIGIGLL